MRLKKSMKSRVRNLVEDRVWKRLWAGRGNRGELVWELIRCRVQRPVRDRIWRQLQEGGRA